MILEQMEERVIGSMFIDQSLIEVVLSKMTREDFSQLFFGECFLLFQELKKTGAPAQDYLLFSKALVPRLYKTWSEANIIQKLQECINNAYAPENTIHFVQTLRDFRIKKKARADIEKFNKLADEDLHRALDALRNDLNDAGAIKSTFELPSYPDQLSGLLGLLDDENALGRDISGLSTGFNFLDKKTNGFVKGGLHVLAGRTGTGKSLLALNFADNIGFLAKKPVLFFSLEMPAHQLLRRTLSRFCRIEGERMFNGHRLLGSDYASISRQIGALNESKLVIHDEGAISVDDIENICGAASELEMVIVDYLGLIAEEGKTELEKYNTACTKLRLLAKRLNIPVLLLAQINREGSKREGPPQLHDLKGSGNIEQDACLVMIMHSTSAREIDLHIVKNRNGESGTKVTLMAEKEFFVFSEGYHV